MKKIDKFIDNLEKRIYGLFRNISRGQTIDQKKTMNNTKEEVIALCKYYYEEGYNSLADLINESGTNLEPDSYKIDKKRDIKETFDEKD